MSDVEVRIELPRPLREAFQAAVRDLHHRVGEELIWEIVSISVRSSVALVQELIEAMAYEWWLVTLDGRAGFVMSPASLASLIAIELETEQTISAQHLALTSGFCVDYTPSSGDSGGTLQVSAWGRVRSSLLELSVPSGAELHTWIRSLR